MNQLTDPRTPPALSNATPPLVTDSQIQHSALECGSRYCAQHRDIWRHYENHICKAAAPPVAEGPVATPRPPNTCEGCKRGLPLEHGLFHCDPDKKWFPHTICMKPAVAEPPEARAAALTIWDKVVLCNNGAEQVECIAQGLRDYAADLQRQLDNWKANARTARKYWRSAEAANQELRSALLLARHELLWFGASFPTPKSEADAVKNSSAIQAIDALLGPQHGDMK